MPASALERRGVVYGLVAYGSWGIIPLFWRLLAGTAALEILAYRIVGSVVVIGAWLLSRGALSETLRKSLRWSALRYLIPTSLLIGVNWLIFIEAVLTGHLADASLGYFINPLLNVMLGVLVLRERLTTRSLIALLFAALGVLVATVSAGVVPWIALLLSSTFALYGLLRKQCPVNPVEGLFIESLLLTVPALIVGGRAAALSPLDARDALTWLWLAMAGPVTAMPLIWFAHAARGLPLSVLGFIQYLAPSLQFLLAVLVFSEPMPLSRWCAFGLIWLGVAVFISQHLAARSGARGST